MVQPDWTLLTAQPASLVGVGPRARDLTVVSAIREGKTTIIVSRFGDMSWHLYMYFEQSNVTDSKKSIDFTRLPSQFVLPVKEAFYRWWLYGMPGGGRPSASTLVESFARTVHFLRWLDKAKVRRLKDVTQLHYSSFVKEERDKGLAMSTFDGRLRQVERLYELRHYCSDALRDEPWPASSAGLIAGFVSNGRLTHEREARTPVIPDAVVVALFRYCEGVVERYDDNATSVSEDELRGAVLFLLGITSGMRSEELLGLEVGCIRTDMVNGVTYTWLRSVEHKLKTGPAEWMVPPDAARWVAALQRCTESLRKEITRRLRTTTGPAKDLTPKQAQSVHALRANRNRLFLASSRRRSTPSTLTNNTANIVLKRVAARASVDWPLEAHQMRRTMAVHCARHELGDLLFLKKQLKHRSLDMTAMYAMNPAQDEALFNEIFDAHQEVKAALLEHWLDPAINLAGGAAASLNDRKISTVKSRKELATNMASKVSIRATGHGWCLAQDEGCGGQGLYEKTRCVDCSDGLIDDRYAPVWQGIFEQQVELLDDAPSLGAGAQRRIRIDVEKSARVLTRLGVVVGRGGIEE